MNSEGEIGWRWDDLTRNSTLNFVQANFLDRCGFHILCKVRIIFLITDVFFIQICNIYDQIKNTFSVNFAPLYAILVGLQENKYLWRDV